jgi:RNA-directed DNA polymerase
MMHGSEKSDPGIVAMKPANKAEQPAADATAVEPYAAEPVERRAGTKGNAGQQSTNRTQSRTSVSHAYGKSQAKGRRRGSPRFSTMSAPSFWRKRSTSLRRTQPPAWIG